MRTMWIALATMGEWLPIAGRLLRDGDVDAFERDTRAYRARYGLGD